MGEQTLGREERPKAHPCHCPRALRTEPGGAWKHIVRCGPNPKIRTNLTAFTSPPRPPGSPPTSTLHHAC